MQAIQAVSVKAAVVAVMGADDSGHHQHSHFSEAAVEAVRPRFPNTEEAMVHPSVSQFR